ncbi:transcriptional regulator, partial [Bacillus thuringiensis]|nr:transcriptional regulator [Bacillus thuringiensis]
MVNKVDVLMHPVRMKICQSLMRKKENGLTPLEMVKIFNDVPQATLYT